MEWLGWLVAGLLVMGAVALWVYRRGVHRGYNRGVHDAYDTGYQNGYADQPDESEWREPTDAERRAGIYLMDGEDEEEEDAGGEQDSEGRGDAGN